MRGLKLFNIIIFLTLSLHVAAVQEKIEILCQGQGRDGFLKLKETAPLIYEKLKIRGFTLDKIDVIKYFAEVDSDKDFFAEFYMKPYSLEKLRYIEGYEKDNFSLDGKNYSVRYLIDDENTIILFNSEEAFISNNLAKAYEKISEKNYFEKKISHLLGSDSGAYFRYIFSEKGTNIYGDYKMKALEYKGNDLIETYFYEKIDGNENMNAIPVKGRLTPIMKYEDLASILLEEIPEIKLSSEKIKNILENKLKGAFLLDRNGEKGVVLIMKKNNDRNALLKKIYTQDIFEKVGVDLKVDHNGVKYFGFPFFKIKKYIVEFDGGVLLTSDENLIEEKKSDLEKESYYKIDNKRITLKYKGDTNGYFGVKKRAFSAY
ncbi:hypothetical protein [Ilyobacter polytropus]|uniref:Uncharacterized protein n=1 Tax=Ilyobacter polytropus (strain ATCC 51220 / DSM 2926 / LMG 16218 / CuHBu1) TaxID=572544 RepID=E3HAY7_ILYPC|nr:hypothetical protein [Ilyobacter polytropus]ADO82136.1 hypothetical protein Ilyop_0347 [Ilyobacter polytropus DSM 2926]